MTQNENETCEEFATALNVLVKDCVRDTLGENQIEVDYDRK